MEALERDNAARAIRGVRPRQLPDAWVHRPRINPAEQALFDEFVRFARFCGGDPRPTDALAWFDMREVSHEERPWLADVFGALSAVLRERSSDDRGDARR